jgi:hypothetical protein
MITKVGKSDGDPTFSGMRGNDGAAPISDLRESGQIGAPRPLRTFDGVSRPAEWIARVRQFSTIR